MFEIGMMSKICVWNLNSMLLITPHNKFEAISTTNVEGIWVLNNDR